MTRKPIIIRKGITQTYIGSNSIPKPITVQKPVKDPMYTNNKFLMGAF